jgi:hypothetical protein
MIMIPFNISRKLNHGSPAVVEAKFEKLALRVWFCIEDALEIVERRKLDGFADRT